MLDRDLAAVAAESQNGVLELSRRASRSDTAVDAQCLWSVLRAVASERGLGPRRRTAQSMGHSLLRPGCIVPGTLRVARGHRVQ